MNLIRDNPCGVLYRLVHILWLQFWVGINYVLRGLASAYRSGDLTVKPFDMSSALRSLNLRLKYGVAGRAESQG
jgi:hypothetical protein